MLYTLLCKRLTYSGGLGTVGPKALQNHDFLYQIGFCCLPVSVSLTPLVDSS